MTVHRPLLSAAALLLGAGFFAPACLDRPLEPIEPRTTSTYAETLSNGKVDKIDILISVDDSKSMADKQAILALAVPQLIESLVNPVCLPDDPDSAMTPVTVGGPTSECPEGTHREFEPVLDIHVGVISSSFGLGETGFQTPGGSVTPCVDRKAHLLTDVPDGASAVQTYQDHGFLAWDPEGKLDPPGENDLDAFITDVTKLVEGVGQSGCGYEASLESWYRFLIDPEPAESFTIEGDKAVPVGIDTELLAQRRAFVRPDSLVAVVMLTDENDCSVRPGFGYLTARTGSSEELGVTWLRPRAVCATDPGSECCAPCTQDVPDHCGQDPTCSSKDPIPQHQHNNLHCFEQKRRFGVDLLQPVDRYVQGLTSPTVPNRAGELVDNPLFVAEDGALRPTDRVFLAGIVGVPYQNVARDPDDLGEGLKTNYELTQDGVWTDVLGTPASFVAPRDAHMVESQKPRPGLPTASSGELDPIHGHEHAHGESGAGDLQYACIFDLPADYQDDCLVEDCDCKSPTSNPLCLQPDGSYGNVQRRAKAYPGLRQLAVLKGVQDQGIVGSICAKQLEDASQPDYGYQPAIGALVQRLGDKLKQPCLPRPLLADGAGQVACLVVEGRRSEGGACDCTGNARRPVPSSQQNAVLVATQNAAAEGLDCFCMVDQLAGDELEACREQVGDEVLVSGEPVHGWCYLDWRNGVDALLEACPADKPHTIRLVGDGQPMVGAKHFITCAAEN